MNLKVNELKTSKYLKENKVSFFLLLFSFMSLENLPDIDLYIIYSLSGWVGIHLYTPVTKQFRSSYLKMIKFYSKT